MPLVDMQKIIKIYASGDVEVRALDAIDLTVHAGEFVAVIGPSGPGKSTLMNILGCLDRPTSGTYRLDGVDVSEMSANQRAEIRNSRLGFVYQNFNLLSRTTALENVELPLIYGQAPLSSRQRRELAREIIHRVGLDGREKHTPAQLSGGQQQRVAIARALITDPPVILADEPTSNLDTRTSQEVMEIFERLNDEGKTVIIITHEHDIAAYAKRVVAFRDGKIVQDAPITERRRAQVVQP
jgi:putative ABC transport system ATP-binding protein